MTNEATEPTQELVERVARALCRATVLRLHPTMDEDDVWRAFVDTLVDGGWTRWTDDARAAIAALSPTDAGDGLVADAARWRALLSSDRIRMIGAAGFDTAEDGTITPRPIDQGWRHFGMEVWDRHPAKGDASDEHGRRLLLAYVDSRIPEPPATLDSREGDAG